MTALRERGYPDFGLKMLIGNHRAERFYTSLGGTPAGEVEEVIDGMLVRDRYYVWPL